MARADWKTYYLIVWPWTGSGVGNYTFYREREFAQRILDFAATRPLGLRPIGLLRVHPNDPVVCRWLAQHAEPKFDWKLWELVRLKTEQPALTPRHKRGVVIPSRDERG